MQSVVFPPQGILNLWKPCWIEKKYETIWAAAGTPFAVFQLKPADLEPLTKGKWIDLSEEKE